MPVEPQTLKVRAGTYTKVLKIVVGTPLRTAVIATDANIDEIIGVDTTGAQTGAILVYNDSSGNWEATNNFTTEDSVIDGKVYPGNLDRQKILIRRSGTQGDPITLRTGELAYSWLADPGTNGFGNGGDRLYIGVGLEIDSAGIIRAERVDTIGGRYFTNLLNHPHGVLTASSAVIVDSNKRINEWFVTNFEADSASITNLSVLGGSLNASTLNVFDSAFIRNLTVTDSVNMLAATINYLLVPNQTELATLLASGAVNFQNTLTVAGVTTVNDSTTINGNLTATGITTLDSVDASNITVTNLVATNATFSNTTSLTGNLSGTNATFSDSVTANNIVAISTLTAGTLTDGTLSINAGVINGAISASFSDSVSAATINVSGTVSGSSLSDGVLSINSGSIDSAINGTFSGTLIATDGTFDSVTTNRLTVLDSAYIENLTVNNEFVTFTLETISGAFFGDSVHIDGNVRIDGNIRVYQGNFFIDEKPLSEIIDSDVALLLHEGEAIDIVYSDDSDKITISAELATFTNLGVASFGAYADSAETIRQFQITAGAVRVAVIDGGFFAFDSDLPS